MGTELQVVLTAGFSSPSAGLTTLSESLAVSGVWLLTRSSALSAVEGLGLGLEAAKSDVSLSILVLEDVDSSGA